MILYSVLPTVKSSTTSRLPLLIEFRTDGLLMFLNGLPNSAKKIESRIAELFPDPFLPKIAVVGDLTKSITIG